MKNKKDFEGFTRAELERYRVILIRLNKVYDPKICLFSIKQIEGELVRRDCIYELNKCRKVVKWHDLTQ